MPKLFLLIGCMILSWIAVPVHAQNITVINHYGDTSGLEDPSFVLSESKQHTLIINYYEPANDEQVNRLEQLIGGALDFYIDQSVEIAGDRVEFRKSRSVVLKELNQIVKDAVKFYNYEDQRDFDGFSDQVALKIEEIEMLDLNTREVKKAETAEERNQLKYYLVQKHLNDLKLLTNTEVGNYSNENLLVLNEAEFSSLDPEKQAELLAELENFQTHDPLKPIPFRISDETLTLLAADDQFVLPALEPDDEPDFAEKVLAMLEDNNQKLDGMQLQINELREAQERDRRERQESMNTNFQNQIDELRQLIVQLVEGKVVDPVTIPDKPTPSVTNLPASVSLGFNSGAASVGMAHKMVLNEVIDILARNPNIKVMVTGFADKTGNASANMVLSQKRARNIRNYMLKSGIADTRIIMNYFGDRDAQPNRRVEIEFLPY
jgi:outer membrane protein OmpA-like peptidoglycan-associated protein